MDHLFEDDTHSSKKLEGLLKEYIDVSPLPFCDMKSDLYAPLCTINLHIYKYIYLYVDSLPALGYSVKLELEWFECVSNTFAIRGRNIMHHSRDVLVGFLELMQ